MSVVDIHKVLKRYWGYDSFRQPQQQVIESVIDGHDTLALMPTGGGKSLCYQVPAMALDGMVLVVSPLIALMKDQVTHLNILGIKAMCIESGMSGRQQEMVLERAIQGKLKLLYVSPERLRQRVFIEHFRRMKVSLIAVDEAHCVSQWGFDFRPSYLSIGDIRQYHPKVPMLALTATATPQVVDDVRRMLRFGMHSAFYRSSFSRPNLSYMVFSEQDKMGRLMRIVNNTAGSGIVYVRNRQRTRQVADYLRGHGVTAEYYHAGRTGRERDLCQKAWIDGRCRVMVATNAFGMGIDKSDVRFVVHLDIPDSPEAYFQEAGRAGRDGAKSYCVILYDDSDLARLDEGFAQKYPSLKYIRSVYKAVCNFYNVPIGSGAGTRYKFDYEAICGTYRLDYYEFFAALQHLQREGLIDVPAQEESHSKILVPCDMEQVYRFRVEHKRYDAFLETLFSHYGGLFSDFIPISERELSVWSHYEVSTVENMLRQLDAFGVVCYEPKIEGQTIIFPVSRVDADNILLSEQNYKGIKDAASQRLDAIKNYVMMSCGCRGQFILRYFGENEGERCGVCDLCIFENKRQIEKSAQESQRNSLCEQILTLLTERPRTPKELAEELVKSVGEASLPDIERAIRSLVDERKVGVNEMFELYL